MKRLSVIMFMVAILAFSATAYRPVDYSQQRQVAGLAYYFYGNDTTLAADSSRIIGFSTPATGHYVLDVEALANNTCRIEIFEDCTVGAAPETLSVLNFEIGRSVPTMVPKWRPTITYAGTVAHEYFTGGYFNGLCNNYFTLEQGVDYYIKATALAADTDLSITVKIYRRN